MKYWIYIVLPILFCSCIGNINESYELETEFQGFEQELAFPLLKSTFTMEDALANIGDDETVSIDADQLISLAYKNTLDSKSGAESIILEPFEIPMPDSMVNFPHTILPSLIPSSKFTVNNGTLTIQFLSGHQEDLVVDFTIQEITNNGKAFSQSINVTYPGAIPVVINHEFSLEDYQFDLSSNQFTLSYSAKNAALESKLLGDVRINFSEQQCKEVTATVVDENMFELPNDGLDLNLFSASNEGMIDFENPSLNLEINNSFGFPVNFFFGDIVAKNAQGDSIKLLSSIEDGFELAYPSTSEMGEVKTTTINFNKENSNIVDLINLAPESISFNSFAMAIGQSNSNTSIFALADSKISTKLSLDIPVWAGLDAFSVERRKEFNFNRDELQFEGSNDVTIDEMQFRLFAKNTLPTGVNFQIYFETVEGTILDSLFTTDAHFIEAANVDGEGNILEERSTTLEETITGNRLAKIEDATHLRIVNLLSSDDFRAVKFFTNNGFDMDLGLLVKLSVD